MKKIITLVLVSMLSFNVVAALRCVPTPVGGGMCCWDTDVDGPFKPPIC
jgi:hypothetical protein